MGQAARTIYASDEAYAALSAQARPAFAEHGGFDTELQLQRRTGEMFWARLRGRAVVAGDPSQGTIWTIEDVTAARAQRELLTFSASHDALTGLLNRAAFEAQLEAATQASAQAPFCTLFIDLDHFKQVNDSGGHAAGDAVLRDVARTLEAQLRRADTVARIGGDEFAVLLPHCPPDQAQLLANKLRAAIEAYELRWESQRFHIGASVGLVSVHGYHHTAAEVLRTADEACYAAKRLGRNRVETHPLVAAGPHPAADDEQQACAFSAV